MGDSGWCLKLSRRWTLKGGYGDGRRVARRRAGHEHAQAPRLADSVEIGSGLVGQYMIGAGTACVDQYMIGAAPDVDSVLGYLN